MTRVPRCALAHLPRQGCSPRLRQRVFAARVMLILAGYACLTSSAHAQQPKAEEYEVKAVYLYNFGRFIEWPASAKTGDSFSICVLGRDPFGAALDTTVAGTSIEQKKLVARRIASTREAADCRILFISSSESSRMKEIVAALDKSPALTVSDIPDFTANGGMIEFVRKENKVRFEVNLTATEKAGLTLSSQLLKVATDIKREPVGGSVKK